MLNLTKPLPPMRTSENDLSDIHVLGDETEAGAICADGRDLPAWLAASPRCKLLQQHRIIHAGIMVAKPPFEVLRRDQSGTFFLACFAGRGSILADGDRHEVTAGSACLLPPHTVNALRVGDSPSWSFAWVRYLEPRGTAPVATVNSPSRGDFDPAPLRAAIEGLGAELATGADSPAVQQLWVDLIQSYVLRFAAPIHGDDRVRRAWERVEADLGAKWSLDGIAAVSSMSAENFRKLCWKAIGRSPMKHLTFLRMRRATELFSTTEEKVETVARSLGYENPYAFSNTFLKWIGVRPSEFRDKEIGPR